MVVAVVTVVVDVVAAAVPLRTEMMLVLVFVVGMVGSVFVVETVVVVVPP